MDSAKLIKINIYIAKIYMMYLVIILIFRITCELLGISSIFKVQFISCLFLSTLVILDYFYSLKGYYNNFRIIQIIRGLMAISFSINMIIKRDSVYAVCLSMFIFLTLLIEIIYVTNITGTKNKFIMFLIIITPMSVVNCIEIIRMHNMRFAIQAIAFNVIIISGMLIFMSIMSHIFDESSIERTQLATELNNIRRSIRLENNKTEVELEDVYEKLYRENSEMLIENLIQQYISSSLEISNLMKLILESLSEALVVNLCCIIVKDEFEEEYQYNTRCNCNNMNEIDYFNSYIEDRSIIEKFRDLKEPYIDNQVKIGEYNFLDGMNINSLLIYPLMNEENWLGMLVIGKDLNDYFLKNMSFFERVSTQFSIALTNARTYTKMEDMAMKDGLTGIYNRAYMIQKINEYISNAVLNQGSLAILLFDIDKFKRVNDQYGHLFGDEVIRVCANISQKVAGQYQGFAARYGGEEFVIVLKKESLEELHEIANNLHEQINQTKIDYRGKSLSINVSIGVAAYPSTCNNPAELLERADKAMYHSKQTGRGSVSFDGEFILK
ncbi:MAG: GGDEF domain-containing protein [Lachnotalea sp.]